MLLLVIAVPLLFTTEMKLYQHRLMSFVWNIGHILLFFSLVWLGLNLARQPSKPGFWALLLGVNILVFGLSVGIEEIQGAQGRQNSLEDIYKNCLGASLALLLHPKTKVAGDRAISVMRGFAFMLLAFALLPLAINTIDALYARASFPVLADFESHSKPNAGTAITWPLPKPRAVIACCKTTSSRADTRRFRFSTFRRTGEPMIASGCASKIRGGQHELEPAHQR